MNMQQGNLPPGSKKIFIIGSGRSGTHWLGYILKAHPDIRVTIEEEPQFGMATAMAVDARKKDELFPKLVQHYRFSHARVAPRHYADKSHPNIWLSEELAGVFPDAVFVGIQRNPYATVASMLKHYGVLAWHTWWKDFPIPNRFLGITASIADTYDSLPLAAKCALRWRAHAEQMRYLGSALKERLCVLSYENLILDTAWELARLTDFLNLDSSLPIPKVKRQSLDRWKQDLRPEDREAIDRIIGGRDHLTLDHTWTSANHR